MSLLTVFFEASKNRVCGSSLAYHFTGLRNDFWTTFSGLYLQKGQFGKNEKNIISKGNSLGSQKFAWFYIGRCIRRTLSLALWNPPEIRSVLTSGRFVVFRWRTRFSAHVFTSPAFVCKILNGQNVAFSLGFPLIRVKETHLEKIDPKKTKKKSLPFPQ